MIIGIDASRAFVDGRTGTENYSYHLIKEILRLPESRPHTFVLFTRPNAILPQYLDGYSNVIVKCVNWKYLWTQIGLATETWKGQVLQYSNTPVIQRGITGKPENRKTGKLKLDVLWVPAHTLPILRSPKIKTVVTIHGLEYQWLPEYKNLLQRWYLPLSTIYATKQADKLIAVSNFTANQLKKELHTSSKKIKVIHEGVVASAQCHSDTVSLQKYGLEYKKYLLFVGTIQPRKNLVALVEAFALFTVENPDYKLVIAGGTGWMAESVLNAPARYGVQEKVVFVGRVGDDVLLSLYQQACVYVQPSLTEGFGLPLLEAMQAGVPVITSDGGALPEVVGEAGVIVGLYKVRNFVNRLAEAMTKLVNNDSLRAKLVALGKKRVSELNWENTAKKTLKLLITTGSK